MIYSGVSAQIKNWAVDPILWDELSPSALKDAVVGTYGNEIQDSFRRYEYALFIFLSSFPGYFLPFLLPYFIYL